MKKIVIAEDDPFMREELAYILQKENFDVVCITSFQNTAEAVLMESPSLVLLDVNLPGATGYEICRILKQRSLIPVLILTSRDQLKDELHALDLGADEFLTKPCHKERLLARIANVLRRNEGRTNMIGGGGALLDRQTYTLYVGEESVVLPENQGKIMELLLTHPDDIVTKDQLFDMLWGTREYIDENALQVNMTRLKKTLSILPMKQKIITVRGVGYRLG